MKRLGIIGCGLRSNSYLRTLKQGLGKEWEVAALADPSRLALDTYMRTYGGPGTRTFSSGPKLFAVIGDNLDAVIIGSPNAKHLESVIPALERKLTIMLEKPVATTVEDCAAMWHAYQKAEKPPLAAGFVLRYTTFYQKVKELLDKGAIGQVLTIEATEMIGGPLTAMYMRGWRRKHDLSGPLILEKCSHDMDVLNWFTGVPATRVSSFSARIRFVPNPEAAMYCHDCRFQNDCRYSAKINAPYLMGVPADLLAEIGPLIPKDNDLCVFNSDKDIPDHQVVNIEYINGILASFTLCTDQPRTTRTIKINGTLGQIVGDIGKDELRVDYHLKEGPEDYVTEQFSIEHDDSSHHGGDSVITNQFKAMLRGEPTPPLAGLREGIDACLVALAAAISAEQGIVVSTASMYAKVYKT